MMKNYTLGALFGKIALLSRRRRLLPDRFTLSRTFAFSAIFWMFSAWLSREGAYSPILLSNSNTDVLISSLKLEAESTASRMADGGGNFTSLAPSIEPDCGAPGGIADNLAVWLQADRGVSLASGKNVNSWEDQSGNDYHLVQNNTARQPTWSEEAINYRPALDFEKSQIQFLESQDGGFYTNDYFIVFVPDNDIYAGGRQGNLISALDGGQRFDFGYSGFNSALNSEVFFHSVGQGYTYASAYTSQRQIIDSSIPYLINSKDNADGNGTDIYFNGLQINNEEVGAYTTISDLPFLVGTGANGDRSHDGKIAEVIIYNDRNNSAERRRIQSYLAIKYGITIDQAAETMDDRHYYDAAGNIIWNALLNQDYAQNIAGIGRDDASCLEQIQSKSQYTSALLQIGQADDLDEGEFLIWGHNGGPITKFGATPAPEGYFALNRVWRVQETGELGNLEIAFEKEALSRRVNTDYFLLADTNNDGSFADETPRLFTLDGSTFKIAGVDLDDGVRFTIAINCASPRVENIPVREEYYLPLPENQLLDVLRTIYPSAADCNSSFVVREPREPVFNYTSIITQGQGTLIIYDHWEDGFEDDLENPVQISTEIWGDGNLLNGHPPALPCDIIGAEAIVLNESMSLDDLGRGFIYDGGDRLGSSGPVAITKANWAEGARTLFAGAVEVFASEFWSENYVVPFGENVSVSTNSFQYVGALVMAKENKTRLDIDLDGDGITDQTVLLDQGKSHLINGGIQTGAMLTASAPVQVHLATGDVCDNFESRWFSLPGVNFTCDAYYSGVSDASVMYYFYNPNDVNVLIKHQTSAGSRTDILVPAKTHLTRFFETSDSDGHHFYTENDLSFYAAFFYSINDITRRGSAYDWGAMLICEDMLPRSLQIGWAYGQDPTLSPSENGSPVWLTAAYPTGSFSSGPIEVCVDFDGDNQGPLSDDNGRFYDQLLTLDEYEAARIFDPDGDQTGTIISICDGSDAILSVHWGADQDAGSAGSPGLDLGTGLPFTFPFYVDKWVEDENGDQVFEAQEKVFYTIDIIPVGQNIISGPFRIIDKLPLGLTYIPGSVEAIMPDGAVSSLNDDSGGRTSFPLDEAGLSIGQFRLIHPGEKLSVRFEARINKEFSGEVANTASVTQGVYQREDETTFEVSEEVTNFDLALRKQLNSSLTPGPFFPGDPVVFTIEVINQGAVDAKNIQINDYFPPGLLLDDPNWKDNGAGIAKMKNLILQLSAGASAVVDIYFIINPDFKGLSLINTAELQQAENDFGLADVDSQPDELQNNDAGGLALSSADNYIDGDGKGVPGDGLAETDEDDHDPAQIRVEQSFDLALRKTLNASLTPGPFKSGDPVTYTIEVYNQGSLSAQNIQINDYFPLSLDLTDPNWTEISPGFAQLKNPLSTLAAGANTSLEITFTIREDYQGERIVNYAEIGGAENEAGLEDRDSQFDADPVNDAGGEPESPADDYLLGDGEGSVGEGEATTDEDDHDPAVIAVEQRFDLALTKELNTELSPGPFKTGSKVNYAITIINQGSIDAQNIQVNDYFPSFLVLADNEWREETPGVATLKTPIANLTPGASVSINIRFVIAPRFSEQSILNFAEIAAAENELGLADADSQADSQADNDGGGAPNSPADNATDGDGSGSPGDTNAETDEDDHDPAWILVEQIFDLALIKRVNTALTPGPFSPGDEVVFTIEIHNQGTLAAENIQINDYIPAGLSLADDDWTIVSSELANLKRPLTSLEAEQTTSIDIRFLIDGDFLGNTLINTAEIASAENALNLNDLDSQADEDSANDAGGAPATLSDNALNGDGSGSPGDPEAATDEDDHDPARITVEHIFDLALTKTVSEATPDPFLPGDPLVFTIEIHNQGTLEAQNIQVNDYIPAGLILADLNWTEVVPGVANLNTPIAVLAAGQTISLDIRFIINEDFQSDQLINIAEIAAAENLLSLADLDSQADDLPNNDAGGAPNTSSDNALNGDGSGSPGATNAETDEDDHDPVQIRVEQSFDLALIKTLNTNLTPGPFEPGDLVTFTISVYNQGSLHAQNIEIRDYFPTALRLNDDNWSDLGFGLALLKTPFDLTAGASTTIDISFNIQEGFQGAQIVNYAEIGGADNTLDYADSDSQADAFPANDAGGLPESEADDYILGDGSGAAGGGEAATDEDDHDPARIVVEQSFDLALTKTLNTELTPGPFRPGDEVVYTITIINQGSLDAQAIEINDYYFPTDLTLADENWEADGFGRAVLENPMASLSVGQSASVDIRFIINPDFEKLSTLNIAEIAEASNLLNLADVDSRPDNEADNDAGGVPNTPSDDALDGNGSGSPGATDAATDEDDHDPALIAVEQIFDLALIKRFNPSFVLNTFSPGGEVVFTFEIHNQGTIDAQNIQINDYIPPGLSLADDDWTEIAPGIANLNTPIVSLAKGQRIDVDIRFLIEEDFLGLSITNIAEIASAENTLGLADFDSRPDNIADNDAGGAADTPSDDALNGDGSGNPGDANPSTDEDDHDPARIAIEHIFDLALIKTLNETTPDPFSPGDPVVFTLEIHNQGTLAAQNIQINDYIPEGLTLADLNWSEIIPGVANLNTPIAGLDGGETIRLDIRFIINNDFQGDRIVNVAEIAFAENALSLNDRDSRSDDNSENDAGGAPATPSDDTLNGDGSGNPNDTNSTTDEDDHDPTLIFVEQSFDLALSKTLNTSLTPGPFAPGDLVTYTINIFNQGSLDAYDIGINDYFPVGLTLSDNNWEENGDGLAVLKTPIANLPAGRSTEIDITFRIQNGFQGIEIVNYAEIGEAENLLVLADKDSRADDQADNDAGGLPESEADDYVLGDGSGAAGGGEAATDEDDHDPARILVEQSFDLALIKTLNTELTPGPFRPGDEVVYTITIINQGGLDAQDIEINDYYFPTDLTLADENWETGGFGKAVLESPIASLSAGENTSVDIRFIINPDFEKLSTLNIAEIAEASNLLNLADVDSRPDNEADNDAGGVPNTPSDDALDGDGSGSPGATDAATDEDDHDPALIAVEQIFDLALVKKVNTTLTPGSFAPGGAVVFTIEIHNQGTLEAQNIQINDYIPAGLILADLNWIEVFPGIANLNSPITSLSKGETTSVDIRFLIREDFLESSITNVAEIAFAENALNLIDRDSQADDLSDNDAGGAPATPADNALNGNGSGIPGDINPLTDEDDHDPAQIDIEITFDLALVKTLSESTPGPFAPGDEVVFRIEIHNQGSLDARNIELHDYFPSGLILTDPAWSETDPGVARLDNPLMSLASGQMTTVDVRFTIDPAFQGASLINYAEISGAENIIGAADKDSQADNIAGNDAGGRPISPADDYLDGDGSGSVNSGQSATDEDDHDPALLRVSQSFDLALTKTVNTTETPGPFFPGEQVTYTITVFNQASLNAQGVQINDYFPESLILTDNDWVEIRPGFAQLRNPIDALQGGASETIDITFTIRSDFQETEIINYAEIDDASNLFGLPDEDSTPDDNDTNDAGGLADSPADDYTFGDGAGSIGGGEAATDEDDHDPARIAVEQRFDLALIKELNTELTADPIYPGDPVVYTITVINQGNLDAQNIQINDYFPTELTLADDSWSESSSGIATLNNPINNLSPGASISVDIRFTVDSKFKGLQILNRAEIAAAENILNLNDYDSQADSDAGNDAGGAPQSDSDNAIEGDGSGTPGDTEASTDEDDQDPALIPIKQVFDLALIKRLHNTVVSNDYAPGDAVVFTIEIHNQGTLDAQNIQINDYIPVGLRLADLNWTEISPGIANLNEPISHLSAEQLTSLTIRFLIEEDFQGGSIVNVAEIASASNELGLVDEDSVADDLPDNDAGGAPGALSDDALNGDGSGNPGDSAPETDEDDQDPARVDVSQTFDLALLKRLSEDTPGPFQAGDPLTFIIEIYNQGNIDASNIQISDYIPEGLILADDSWSENSLRTATLKQLIPSLSAGASTAIEITFTIDESFQGNSIVNYAEISAARNALDLADVDSNPDSQNDNDAGGEAGAAADDYLDGNGTGLIGDGAANTDEDDHDPAQIIVEQFFDLALTKTLNTELTPGPFQPGDEVIYTITLINQGGVDASDIQINDYFPEALTLADDAWEENSVGIANLKTQIGHLAAAASATIDIRFTINSDFAGQSILNIAEIAGADNLLNLADSDSQADNDADNDAGGAPGSESDDAIDGNGSGSPGVTDAATDEDDHDPTLIVVDQVFDLALIKYLNTTETPGPFSPGDPLVFTIEIQNQGTIGAQSIQINDYIPAGLSLADANWTEVSPGVANLNTPIASLAARQTTTVDIRFLINSDFQEEQIVNLAEIASADNALGLSDLDSTADNIANNDAGGAPDTPADNSLNGDGGGLPGDAAAGTDEDDHDPARIILGQTFDLALNKKPMESGSLIPGSPAVFIIEVFNQGSLDAFNVQISDYIPEGLILNDVNWSESSPGIATLNAPISIVASGTSTSLSITFMVDNNFQGNSIVNYAEISGAENALGLADGDSRSDNQKDNDAGGRPDSAADDFIGGNGSGDIGDGAANTDEDDHDPAMIEIAQKFDLALRKRLDADVTPGPFAPSDPVTFTIEIFNQGSIDAADIQIVDYIPDDLILNDLNWSESSPGLATLNNPIVSLSAGASITLTINFEISDEFQEDFIINYAEISAASNVLDIADIDSRPDDQNDNDSGGRAGSAADNAIEGDGTGAVGDGAANTDEDDHDPASITVEQFFDLALKKTVNSDLTPGSVSPGDPITFSIEIYNQGSLDAFDVQINDYIPAGLRLIDDKWTENSPGIATLKTAIEEIPVNSSSKIDISFIVESDFEGTSLTNRAEIAAAANSLDLADRDSQADNIADNDAGGAPGSAADDAINGDASGLPGDTAAETDEDDHDPATISIEQVFDLALIKRLNETLTPGPFLPGDPVVFSIEIHNQGTLEAQNIQINDYMPGGLNLADDNWTEVFPGVAQLNMPIASLAAQETVTVNIRFVIDRDFQGGGMVNFAEIAEATNALGLADRDSEADGIENNDAGGAPDTPADNSLNGDGGGSPGDASAGTDEDDHDPAGILLGQTFDLALTKRPAEDVLYNPGDPLTFIIEIFNQGSLNASNIQISDYIPEGLSLNDANWIENSPGIATLNDPISSLAAGTSTAVNITFTIDDTFQGAEIVNYAEISGADNALGLADEDSRPDNQKDNDAGGSPGSEADDFKDGNGSGDIGDGTANTDEDDHDPAVIRVAQTFDLALVKRLDSDLTPGPFVPGDEVRFIIEVFNQGSLDASDIRISDYIPDGLNLNDPSWRENGAGILTQDASIPRLAAGQSTTLSISFIIDESFQGDVLINYAEISGAVNALGLIDIDSRLDNQNDNDAGGQAGSEADDVVDGNGTGLIGDGLAATDEDDHDPAVIAVEQTFDLALRKMLNTNVGQEPFAPEDELSFIIEVFNQGRLDAQNIQLNDYIPAGLILADDNWVENSVGVANLKNPIASLAAGETISLDIRFTVDPNFSEASLINLAEIAAAENALGLSDFDSRFDDQADNDAGGAPDSPADNALDGDGTGLVGGELAATDEDDADAEAVDLCLALDAGSDGSVEVCIGCGVNPINVDLMSVLNGTPDDGGFWEDLSGAGVDLSDPSQVNFAGLALGSYFFRYTLGDGGNCGSVSAEARIDLHSFATMSCNNRIIFPLPSANGCSVQISPDLLLEGVRRCNAEYEVRLYDERGVFLGDVITGEQAGQTIIAEVHNLTCGNYCSGELVIEDSVAPEITCPDNMADLICSDADSILNNIASLAITGEPVVFDNCSINNQLSFTDQLVENGDCGDVTVARLFTLVDASDNEASCLQLITVRKPDFNDLTFPPEMVNLSCDSTFQLDGNGRPHPSVSGYPLVNTTYGSLPINQVYCNLGASYSDSEPISQCAATYAVVRTWTVVDWCAEATRDYSQIITVEDIVAPEVICRTRPGGEPDTLQFSTGPFNCTAAFAVPTPEINDNCSDWTVAVDVVTDVEVPVYDRFGRIVGTEIDTQIIASVAAGSNFPYVSNIPAGCHRFRYTVEDACGNTTIEECAFCVSDGVEPVAVCDNSLTVAIGGGGFGRLLADDLDEGSWDNCGLAGIGIRRQIARNEDCEEVAPEFSEWSDMIDLNCCDVGQDLVVQLVAIDSSGNENICQSILRLADNIPPDCIAPPNRSVGCNELPFGFDPGDVNDLQSLFGVASAEDNCMTATWEELTPSINLSECGDGYITRIFRATDAQGNLSVNTCQQALTIEKYHDYDIQFPADVVSACGQDNPPSVLALGRLGCNDMGVSIFDEVHTDIPGICSRTLRRYRVINWCEYDGESDQIIIGRDENCNGEGGEEAVWVLHRNGTTYIDRDNDPLNNAPSVGESQCSPDNPDGYWRTSSSTGFWEYTQYIDVIDENPAEIQFEAQGVFCSLQEDCNGVVTLPFTVVEDCDQLTFNLYFDENGDGSLDSQLDTEQSLRGNFPNYNVTAALPIGSHAIEVQMIEGCGTTVTARLDFSIADCLAPPFNCLDTLSFDLEPQYEGTDADGDGDIDLGAYTIEATDLALDMAIDCTGPVFYSISREGEDPDPAKTRLIVTCDDPDTMRVKVYAWDQAFNPYLSQPNGSVGGPNYGYCETILLVKDELFNACGGGFHPGEISGVILTEVDNPVEGVAVNLSGPNSLQYATGVDGAYIFDNLEEGFDYTVTPRLNLDHRNGVSTFDLTLLEKHILGVKRLDTPYKLIAADINRSGTISVFDVVQMRKLILGEVDAFEYNTSWRFVRADHVFIDPTNPFAGFLPEVITLNNLFEPFEDGDFIGIKIGDVNLTAIANSDMGVAPRALNDTIRFLLNDQVVQAGNIYQIPFYLPALNEVEGFQYTLEVDRARAKILGVEAAVAKDANFGLRYSEEGLLTSSWHRDASAPVWTPTDSLAHMFTLILEAEADGRLSEVLSLSSRITGIEAYDREGLIKSIALTYEEENKPSDQPRLYQNYPNPFGEKTTIGFYLPRATDIRFSIRDIRGRLLFTQEGWKAAGEHQISLEQGQLEQSGVYYYTLITGDGFKASKKMIRK